jgi:hypothetical protein
MSFEASLGFATEDGPVPVQVSDDITCGQESPVDKRGINSGEQVEPNSVRNAVPHRWRSSCSLEPAVGVYFSQASIGTK